AIISRLLAVDPAYHVLVVDDNSPDGTADVVARLALADSRVHLLRRHNERGFGTAVRDGFKEALRLGAPFVGEMDADGSHDPAMFPALTRLLQDGQADVAIGSRYVAGSTMRGWGPWRYVNSHDANRLA